MELNLEVKGTPLIYPCSLIGDQLMIFHQNYIYQGIGVGIFHGLFESRKRVAVKRIQLFQDKKLDQELLKEAKIMLDMGDHPNILRYYCCYQNDNFLFIASELCEGTLQDWLERRLYQEPSEGPPIGNERDILLQVTQALGFLHDNRIIHRDIKPINIFISKPCGRTVPPRVKLADFNFSYRLHPSKTDFPHSTINPTGTRGWMAPELYDSDAECDSKVDIFALGCVFGYTLTIEMKHPFGDDEDERQVRIKEREATSIKKDDLLRSYSWAFPLVQSMLEMEPTNRPTALQVLDHPLFRY